jgi:hypothetical protein
MHETEAALRCLRFEGNSMDLVTGFMAFLATILIAHAVYDQFS